MSGAQPTPPLSSRQQLDEAGLLTAMAYVDLNPVRAGIAATPEESEFTSIYARIRHHTIDAPAQRSARKRTKPPSLRTPPLIGFRDAHFQQPNAALPSRFTDYLQLLDWTGRVIRADKTGAVKQSLPPILTRLRIDPELWQQTMRPGGNRFGRTLGALDQLHAHAKRLGQSWIKGLQMAQRLYCRP